MVPISRLRLVDVGCAASSLLSICSSENKFVNQLNEVSSLAMDHNANHLPKELILQKGKNRVYVTIRERERDNSARELPTIP